MTGFLIQSPVEHYASATPDHPALCCQGQMLSYQALDEKSNQLAHTLIANGARPQDRVAIYLHKSLEMGIAIYGILKAGCVFVPIDPFMPVERLSVIIQDCGIRHVLCSDVLAGNVSEAGKGAVLTLYGVDKAPGQEPSVSWQTISQAPADRPPLSIIDQDLAYLMYTSGSTGTPKGMMHTHHGSISYARWGLQHVALTAVDRVASHAPLHFDLSIFDFFSTAQAGATVVLVPETVTRFPASWTKTIESERITVVFTVPYTLIAMLEKGAMEQRDLRSLRWILYGGEAFPVGKLRQLMLALDHVRFTNVYGPAEAPSCTCHDVTLPEEGRDDPVPIGTVSQNSSGIIVDSHDEDCEDGEPGELCIRSSTLTRGYWNRPELNSKAFLLRPGVTHFSDIYYRTGDVVRRDTNGLMYFLGRVDRMVKVRGQRVELDEVESVLASYPAVFEVAAIAVPDGTGSQIVVAAASSAEGEKLDEGELLRFARERLSSYALPQRISIHAQLPHNSSGKIDRKLIATQWADKHG